MCPRFTRHTPRTGVKRRSGWLIFAGWSLCAGCRYNHGMAVDSEHHRAFLLCGGNHTLTVVALDSRRALAHFPLPAGADVVKYDSGLRRAYAACASGFISIVQEDDPAHFHKVE